MIEVIMPEEYSNNEEVRKLLSASAFFMNQLEATLSSLHAITRTLEKDYGIDIHSVEYIDAFKRPSEKKDNKQEQATVKEPF